MWLSLPICLLPCCLQAALVASDLQSVKTSREVDHSLDVLTEFPSDTFPAPDAPPPTEVTRAHEGEGGDTNEAGGGVGGALHGGAHSYSRLTKGLEEAFAAYKSRMEKGEMKKKDNSVRFVAMSFLTIAFAVVVITLLLEYGRSLKSLDAIFSPSLQPQGVPQALNDLLAKRKVVVFLADDCLMCMAGLEELKKSFDTKDSKPLPLLITGHRLEAAVRSYLEKTFNVSRLPAILVEGNAYTDFTSAIKSAASTRHSRYRRFPWKNGGGSVGGRSNSST